MIKKLISLIIIFVYYSLLAEYPKAPIALLTMPNKILANESFTKTIGKEWFGHKDSFSTKSGLLHIGQKPGADHGAVCNFPLLFKNTLIQFSIKIVDAKNVNFVIDDKNYKDNTHAGHICRATMGYGKIGVQDGKTGVFNLNNRKKYKTGKNIKDAFPNSYHIQKHKFQTGKWYTCLIEIFGDEIVFHLDEKTSIYLKSPGIAHNSKTKFGFTVTGKDVLIDNLKIWSVTKNKNWSPLQVSYRK